AATLRYRRASSATWETTPMHHIENDRWRGAFLLAEVGRYRYTIEAVPDPFVSWRTDVGKKITADHTVSLERADGVALIQAARDRATGSERAALADYAARLAAVPDPAAALAIADEPTLGLLMARHLDRRAATVYDRELEVVVDRPAAWFGAWYEMFPRSQSGVPGRSGTFADAEARLLDIAGMGFDVVYLPPIHPIGHTHRKGRNNRLGADPADPGSPWAIGGEHGGHEAVDPGLGTLDDFDRFVAAARARGLEVALDLAIQCSPDHPWVKTHPEWFFRHSDGTIRFAENPPKKYQDVYPVNLDGPDRAALWEEIRRLVLHWIGHGVRIFRVDNPHTKPIAFWTWLIGEIQAVHPDVIFLAEAFTRPKVMRALAKAGFTQSYTYFTWRNFKEELTDYLTELTQSEMRQYFRGNFFVNTPDILPEILQHGGRPAFQMRLILAATLSSLYGMYSGYELCENTSVPGTEEYLDSEKYEIRVRDWDRPGNIKAHVARINRIRRENPALHTTYNLRFYPAADDHILFYGKMTPDRDNVVLVAVNLDPFAAHTAEIEVPLRELGLPEDATFQMHDLLTDTRALWRGSRHLIRLDPAVEPAAVWVLRRWLRREHDFDYYF
ncbi:MAG TPA: maltotransferase domain-containing protein, partial [Methylomirabilota bacterium]|nr:maltotransferase domain-containing protein [Methylomirabilota bacterium]